LFEINIRGLVVESQCNNTTIRFDDISIIKQGCSNQYRLDNSFTNPFSSLLKLDINNSELDEMKIYSLQFSRQNGS